MINGKVHCERRTHPLPMGNRSGWVGCMDDLVEVEPVRRCQRAPPGTQLDRIRDLGFCRPCLVGRDLRGACTIDASFVEVGDDRLASRGEREELRAGDATEL